MNGFFYFVLLTQTVLSIAFDGMNKSKFTYNVTFEIKNDNRISGDIGSNKTSLQGENSYNMTSHQNPES